MISGCKIVLRNKESSKIGASEKIKQTPHKGKRLVLLKQALNPEIKKENDKLKKMLMTEQKVKTILNIDTECINH